MTTSNQGLLEARETPSDDQAITESSIPGRPEASSSFQETRCAHVSPHGAGCLAHPLKGSLLCFYHDQRPEIVAKRQKAQEKGCKKARRRDGLPSWSSRPIDSMEDLKTALSELFNAGMAGDITTSRLAALASVANALTKVIEQSDLERRITELEELTKGMK